MPLHKKDLRKPLRSPYVWHRWIGIGCALFVIWLSFTGILLNHASGLGLDRQYIHASWLLRAYGIEAQRPERGFPVHGRWITQAGDLVFLDAKPVGELRGPLIGAAALPGTILVAAPDAALLLTAEGDLIESLGSETLPPEMLAVTDTGRQILIRTVDGIYASGAELARFEPYAGAWPEGSGHARPLPPGIARDIAAAGAGIRLSRERVLADLHSGRLLGSWGPWLMDAAALGFIALSASGLWLWLRYRRTRRLRARPQSRPR